MSRALSSDVELAVESVRGDTCRFLCDLIRIPSLPGSEARALEYAGKRFAELAQVEPVALSNAIRQDPDYSDPIAGLEYDGRSNLKVRLPGSGRGRKLLLNTHLDVVPPSQGQDRPFEPRVESGTVYGRGACDAKGQVAVIFAALSALKRIGAPLSGDVIAHLVVEEEIGGNGTLGMIRLGEQADACIVMEPTSLRILPSVRGAVWFRVTCTGRPGHSGRAHETISGLKMAMRVIVTLEQYHGRLLAASRGIPLFDSFANPMPITFGKLTAGDWTATAPAQAVVEGVLGFLPNKTRFQVMEEMRQAIFEAGDAWLREHFKLEFTYRHDSHVLDPDHPLVCGLQTCCQQFGAAGEVTAMTASCDSWYYNNQLGIPSVVFGAGSLGFAHTNEEQIHLEEVMQAAAILVRFIQRWCEDKN
jgi:acetylornithine deacetylase